MEARNFISGLRASSSMLCRTSRTTQSPFHQLSNAAFTSSRSSSKIFASAILSSRRFNSTDATTSSPSTATTAGSSTTSQSETVQTPVPGTETQTRRPQSSGLRGVDETLNNLGLPRRSANTSAGDKASSMRRAQNVSRSMAASSRPAAKVPIKLRLKPSIGRTIRVDDTRGRPLARALVIMESECAQNKIKQDFMSQRFHTRRGQKAKETKSLRWRKLFKVGFLDAVDRIHRLKKMGW